jgi:hypothetical protein
MGGKGEKYVYCTLERAIVSPRVIIVNTIMTLGFTVRVSNNAL